MRRTTQWAATVAALILVSAGVAHGQALAQGKGGTIGGEIMDRRGKPLVAAHVDLLDNTTGVEVSAMTDANGNYVLSGLAIDHDYAMTVRCIGFLPQRRHAVAPSAHGAMDDVTLDPISDAHRTVVGDVRRGQ
ncbi:MAG TPA: carboxypeptidase-like regulatory domain-containing protein [Gemmatimonadaceae bacterium]|jgi:hypothetical protein|nr:carboxypeptidase-like regulatory domain-containing protein [Gemmatimonadaceae bacterium]